LSQVLADIELQNIPYSSYPFFPWSKNSNSVVSEALFVTGLPVSKPPVWAPGWGVPLFPCANGGVTAGPPYRLAAGAEGRFKQGEVRVSPLKRAEEAPTRREIQ
jgi:hypothetical protein